MTNRNRPLIAGNWKMHGLLNARQEILSLIEMFSGSIPDDRDVLICPPFTLVAPFAAEFSDEAILIGGQNCHPNESGAHTGDISAEMLEDAGAAFVIVGHSERRTDHGETSAMVKAKAEAALRAGLTPIICVGETQAQREAGAAEEIVKSQLQQSLPNLMELNQDGEIVIAYEPIWAIGTGLTPTPSDIHAMHTHLRAVTGNAMRLIYGGSVKPANAEEILSIDNVDGALVGGASLKAQDFYNIVQAAPAA